MINDHINSNHVVKSIFNPSRISRIFLYVFTANHEGLNLPVIQENSILHLGMLIEVHVPKNWFYLIKLIN